LVFAILAYLPAWPALAQSAQAVDASATFNIPAGDLAGALDRLSRQTGIQLMYQPGLVAGKQVGALSGHLTWREALDRLLQGSGLVYQQVNATTIVIRKSGGGPKSGARPRTMPPSKLATGEKPTVTDLKTMTVTGTRIRGGTTPSPVITIGAENIREEGFTDLGEVIRSVPQNFTGGQNPGVFMGGNVTGGGLANQNMTGGSSLNLRGLGPDASLTLLNGRRMAHSGFVQAVDISAIPVDAVERVEIMADGASAIYGSDAVGGVANVILKRDVDGITLGARYGGTSDGGLATREYTATGGTTWLSGGLIAAYKDATVDPIYARQRDYSEQLASPSTIYPGSELHSGLFSMHQSFGEAVELHLDALRTKRDQTYYLYYGSLSSYSAMLPETTTTLVSPSVDFSLPNDWMLTVGGVWGRDEFFDSDSEVSADTGVSVPSANIRFRNKSGSYEVTAEGPVFKLAGGDARLAVGAGYRKNDFSRSDLITKATTINAAEGSRFAYVELNLPLVGNESDGPGSQRLDVTAAFRSEDYDSVGHITTPKLGMSYSPSADFTLKTSWGRSFKMPTLYQQHSGVTGLLVYPSALGGTDDKNLMLLLIGGNTGLKPERARTWTTSLAFHPMALPGLETELTWFNIDYAERVVQPITNYAESLSNPNYREFVEYSPSAARQAEMLALAGAFYNLAGSPYDPGKVAALVDGRYVNATRQAIKGLDLSGSYQFDLGSGQMTVRGSTSWLDSTQQTRGTPAPYDLAGMLNNPAKLHGRIGAIWSARGFSASAFANYASGITNPADGKKSASFTTFDGTLHYGIGDGRRWWSGLEFALSVINLFDRAPPLYRSAAPAYVAPYDSTNYSAIGRFLSLSASKHW
jgi:outer membrane receptor protein involved in Fe transport